MKEFEVLLHNPGMSPDELTKRLPKRSADAIIVVRNGIHAFHTGRNVSMLSRMMISRLEGETESVLCPVCDSLLG